MKVPCYCKRYMVEENTAQSAVAGVPTCNPSCHNAALDAQRVPERLVLILMESESH